MLGKDGRIYDNSFDFNHDGQLNSYERAMMDDIVFGMSEDLLEQEGDADDVEYCLALEGVDIDDLEDMDEDERREVLEDAGLDPDDFDF